MSSSERFATMPFMIALSRSGFLPLCALKSRSCFCRYSAIWPAIFGLAAATLLPSGAWHAAQTWPAIPWALSCADAVATRNAAATTHARFIPAPAMRKARFY